MGTTMTCDYDIMTLSHDPGLANINQITSDEGHLVSRTHKDSRLNSRTGGIYLTDVPHFDIDLRHRDMTQGQQHLRKHPQTYLKLTQDKFCIEHETHIYL